MLRSSWSQGSGRARERLVVGLAAVRIEQVLAVARGEAEIVLDADPTYRSRLAAGRAALERALQEGQPVYGVTTGVGSSVKNAIAEREQSMLPLNLLRFHGCGTGRLLGAEEAAAVVVVRVISLARGFSAVRPEVMERLCDLVERRIVPCIPEEGSVGASGDLTPLSYLAALLVGEREALVDGEIVPAREALERAGLAPLVLEPKESLAIMNGTSVMSALACVAFARAARLARLACTLTAMVTRAISGNPQHFAPEFFELKPHPGTIQAGGLDPRGSRAFGREPPRSPTGPLLDSPRARAVHRAVRTVVPPVVADRRQHHDIAHVLDLYRSGKIPYDTALFETEAS